MASNIHYYIIFVIVIHYYKIPLLLWYFAYRGCMYTTIVNIEMCLSTNDINKSAGEHKIVWNVNILDGCSVDGSTATFVVLY